MTCKTCKREDFPEDCGPKGEEPCPCCGMQIIAVSDTYQAPKPQEDTGETESE